MSWRTGTPNTASARTISPALPPSMVLTAIFMISPCRSGCRSGSIGRRFAGRRLRRGGRFGGLAQAGRIRRILRAGALGGVLDDDVAAARAGNGARHQQQAPLVVGGDDLEVLRGHALVAVVARHLLAREGTAGILAVAGRAVAAMRDRHAVAGFEAVEVPAHHRAGEAAADRGADDVDELAGHEVARHQLGADLEHGVLGDAELDELLLGLDLGLGEVAAHRLADVLDLGLAVAELDGGVAVLVVGAHRNDLQVVHLQHGDGHVLACVVEDAGHANLLGDETATHGPVPSLPWPAQAPSLISTSTPEARSSFISASTVCGVGSTISSTRLWVRISNCSRDFLSICGERLTVNFSIPVGSGIGPRTCAPVRLAVLTISLVDESSTR